jgi:hypothetical protein
VTFKKPSKNIFLRFFAYFFCRYIYIIQRYKDIMKSQNSRNQGFLTSFAWWWKDPDLNRDLYLWLTDPDPGGPKTYGSYRFGTLLGHRHKLSWRGFLPVLEREIFAFFFLKEGRSNNPFSSGTGPPRPLPPGAVSGSLAAVGGRPGNSRPGWVDLNMQNDHLLFINLLNEHYSVRTSVSDPGCGLYPDRYWFGIRRNKMAP